MNTYECSICLNVNHVSHFHCSTCGTIPKQYSVLNAPARFIAESVDDVPHIISVVVAFGADRAEHHRTVRTYLRTVESDYYAS